jgi:hypothetical protein
MRKADVPELQDEGPVDKPEHGGGSNDVPAAKKSKRALISVQSA